MKTRLDRCILRLAPMRMLLLRRIAPALIMTFGALLMCSQARADTVIYYSKPENSYGRCYGYASAKAHTCARSQCEKYNGTQCEPVAHCNDSWGAVAFSEEHTGGFAVVCGMPNASVARIWALTNCSIVSNTLCMPGTTFRGSRDMGSGEDREFYRTWYAQTMLQLRNHLGDGKVDGVPGRKTETAIRAFQRNVGLPEDGRLTDETFSRLLESVGGVNLLVDDLRSFFDGYWKENPQEGYRYALSPLPRKSFDEETSALSDERQRSRLAVILRSRGYECAIPAAKVRFESGKWAVTCAEARYDVTLGPDGSEITLYGKDGEDQGSGRSREEPIDSLVATLVNALVLEHAGDWTQQKLEAEVERLRQEAPAFNGFLDPCIGDETRDPVLSGKADPQEKLAAVYSMVDGHVGRFGKPNQLGVIMSNDDMLAYFLKCSTYARYTDHKWATLLHSLLVAELNPDLGVYPVILLTSGELGIVDLAKTRQLAQRASGNSDWAGAVMDLTVFFGSPDEASGSDRQRKIAEASDALRTEYETIYEAYLEDAQQNYKKLESRGDGQADKARRQCSTPERTGIFADAQANTADKISAIDPAADKLLVQIARQPDPNRLIAACVSVTLASQNNWAAIIWVRAYYNATQGERGDLLAALFGSGVLGVTDFAQARSYLEGASSTHKSTDREEIIALYGALD